MGNISAVQVGALAAVGDALALLREEFLKSTLGENEIRREGLVLSMELAPKIQDYTISQFAAQADSLTAQSINSLQSGIITGVTTLAGEIGAHAVPNISETQLKNIGEFNIKAAGADEAMREVGENGVVLNSPLTAEAEKVLKKLDDAFKKELTLDDIASLKGNLSDDKLKTLIEDHTTKLQKVEEKAYGDRTHLRNLLENQVATFGTGLAGKVNLANQTTASKDEGTQASLKQLLEMVQQNVSKIADTASQAKETDQQALIAVGQLERGIVDASNSFRG